MAKILIIGGPGDYRQAGSILRKGGHDPVHAASMKEGMEKARMLPFGSLILSKFRIGDMGNNEAPEFISELRKRRINHPVIVYGENLTPVDVCKAMNNHKAIDFIQQPAFDKELLPTVNRHLPRNCDRTDSTTPYPRCGAAFIDVMDNLRRIARLDANVMIIGEPGLGKERLARFIHCHSNRADKPLVIINHPDFVTETLSETPCPACHIRSCFEKGNGGTVVIRNLHSFCRMGQSLIISEMESGRYDVRIISTADKSIREKIAEGSFDHVLMHGVSTASVVIPSLQEHPEDIEPLVKYFLKEFSQIHNRPMCRVSPGALRLLREYHWPMNARELKNAVTQCAAVSTTGHITVSNLHKDCFTDFREHQEAMIELDEESRVVAALRQATTLKRAAELLGVTERTLCNKRRKYGLDADGNKIMGKVSV